MFSSFTSTSSPRSLSDLPPSAAGGSLMPTSRSDATFPTTFPREWWPGRWSAPRGGRGVTRVHKGLDDIQDEAHDHLDRPQRAPGAPSGRYLCPQTVTARHARTSAGLLPWQERLGRGGGGVRAIGMDPPGHQRPVVAIDEPRSARPMDTTSTSRGSLRGWGRAWRGGQWIDMRGFCPGLVHPERRM